MLVTHPRDIEAACDPALPTLRAALDPQTVMTEFQRKLPLFRDARRLFVHSIQVVRHKPGKRAVVEYDLEWETSTGSQERTSILGKVRSKRFGNEGYRRQVLLWKGGFDDQSLDQISVPEPLGVVPLFQMWFQRKISGSEYTQHLTQNADLSLAARMGEVAVKLHRLPHAWHRRHGITEELEILDRHLPLVTESHPEYARRIRDILSACRILGATIAPNGSTSIHRDYYPDQVIVSGHRLYLLDLDLCCEGHQALDLGNFAGHIQEYALRTYGSCSALQAIEQAMIERFLALTVPANAWSVQVYTILTLVRHIYLSTRFPERHAFTPALIAHSEDALTAALQQMRP